MDESQNKDRENKLLIGDILVDYGIAITPLLDIFQRQHGQLPERDDIVKEFCQYLSSNNELLSKNIMYKDKNGITINLNKLLCEMTRIRNIAAHQTWELVSGFSKLPKSEVIQKNNMSDEDLTNIYASQTVVFEDDQKMIISHGRGVLCGNYIGDAKGLHDDWVFYSEQFKPIFDLWSSQRL